MLTLRRYFNRYKNDTTSQRYLKIYEVNTAKRNQIENFIKNYFINKIDVNLIIWSKIFIILKKNFFIIWSLFIIFISYGSMPRLVIIVKGEKDYSKIIFYTWY